MNNLIEARNRESLKSFCAMEGTAPLTAEAMARKKADANWMVTGESGEIRARCSLWWTATPPYPGNRVGVIGHYAALDSISANQLLRRACRELVARGCTMAIGPMDGNTWQGYRFTTERGAEPAFFLEPDNPPCWPEQFIENGFATFARYSSALTENLGWRDPRINRVAERMKELGVRIRPLQPDRFVEELSAIYDVSAMAFRNNFLYTPISRADFIAQYAPVERHIRPELVLIAERGSRPVGFIFSLPDLLRGARGASVDTIIIKTAAVMPGLAYGGLGNLLVARCHEAAQSLGYSRAIHALMHEANNSRNLSNRYARPVRRYELFFKSLSDNGAGHEHN